MNKNGTPENLISNSDRTPIERKERASNMGKASGAARRKNATDAQIMRRIERMPLNEIGKAYLKRGGMDLSEYDPDDLNYGFAKIAGMYVAALRGNPKAFEQLARYKDQQKKDKLEIEKLKAEIRKLKAETEPEGNDQDDGFITALDASAAEDWREAEPDDEKKPDEEDGSVPV